jgi:hypothetical protein
MKTADESHPGRETDPPVLEARVGVQTGECYFKRMTSERFAALALWGMPVKMREEMLSASHWSTEDERVLVGVFHILETKEFMCVAFARDEEGRYRPYMRSHYLPTARAGEFALQHELGGGFLENAPTFTPLDDQPPGVDLFAPIAGVSKLHDAFVMLRDGFNQASAREILTEIIRWVPDLDGNLVRDFQTTGYSARVWELYLWAALRALNFDMDYSHAVPDFCLRKGDVQLFIEATTVNAQDTLASAMAAGPPPAPPENFWEYMEHVMPQKFGSPLFSKLQKRYWEKPHIAGHPLIFAIADFHAPASMRWSHTALPFYLYGVGVETSVDCDGKLFGVEKSLADHVVGSKVVPTNFFAQPDTEHISAVLFSNAGTIMKFSRMGIRAGYGDPWVSLVRKGVWNDPRPRAFEGIPFNLDVENPTYEEGWADEIEMYHNPNALHPVDEALFPGIAHIRVEGREHLIRSPSHRVLYSSTTSYDFKRRTDGRPAWAKTESEGEEE